MKPNIDINEWKIIESKWDPKHQIVSESLFSLGNGRMGQRANNEECFGGDHLQGTYIGGIYYPDKTRVGWWKNGYPDYFAKVINAVNFTGINISINSLQLDLNIASVKAFHRELDMQHGVLKRDFQATLRNGITAKVSAQRFLSIVQDDLAIIKYEIQLEEDASIEITPFLDFNVTNSDSNWDETFWESVNQGSEGESGFVHSKTKKLDFQIAAAMECRIDGHKGLSANQESYSKTNYSISAKKNKKYTLYKYVSVVNSQNTEINNLEAYAKKRAINAVNQGFNSLLQEHSNAWLRKWELADIIIEGDPPAQQAIRYNIFQLLQTFTGVDSRLNIGPKGFTGEKYGGSTYWDTEAYCLPFFLASSDSKISKNLLIYRYKQLGKAIENAEKLGFKNGAALYPMVTMNGEESHNEWEITFEEIHRNGAIVYGIYNYIRHTQDYNYLKEGGLEVIVAICRFWAQRVNWSFERNKYVILGVTGPNEYENNVNNNYYTNFIASWCLSYAIKSLKSWEREDLENYSQFIRNIKIELKELKNWKKISENIYFPFSEKLGIFLQQDGFLDKEIVPAKNIPQNDIPINQKWSWDRILRSCFIKQADTLQGMFFFEDQTSLEVLRKNFDFYEPLTVHESSLSPSVHCVLANRLGYKEKAYDLYLRTSRLDLDDYNNEVHQGLHITAMGGTWMSVVYGFGGMKIIGDDLHFEPELPKKWAGLNFHLRWRNAILQIAIRQNVFNITNIKGDSVDFVVYKNKIILKSGENFNSNMTL
jgi:maltose phosphorylase